MRTLDAAQGHWRKILIAAGIEADVLKNRHGTCPLCSGKHKFRFDDKGLGSWICNLCGAGYGYKLLKQFTGRPDKELLAMIDELLGHRPVITAQEPDPQLVANRRRLLKFQAGLRECGTVTASYLKNRGVGLTQMRFMREHPAAPYYQDGQLISEHPAMVNQLINREGQTITFHVTYLSEGGWKAEVNTPKKLMTPTQTITGSAIRLSDPHERMAITEGIETALGVMRYERIPCWACYAANNLAKFDPPEGIESLIIFGDRDRSFTGQAAAYELARRMQARGIDVEVVLPPDVGKDWLEHWVEECA